MDDTPKATYDNLNDAGYLVVKGVLSAKECEKLSKALIHATTDLVFTRQGFDVDPDDPTTLDLFMDQKLREKKLGETAKGAVWREGNTRQPLISKSCGMTHIHYNEELLERITYNERLYDAAAKVIGTPHLVHGDGPERFCIKPRGATDMPQHIDSNLFLDEVNYPYRIQSLVTIQIDEEISPRDSGTLCLLTYFHHYWDFARELFHPKTGLVRFPELKSRFFVLPTNKKDKKHFDLNYLPALKKHAKAYGFYLEGLRSADKDDFHEDFYEKLQKKGITVPPTDKKYLEKMDWTPVKLAPGDMVFWHQYLPHRSLRQRSKTPRICAYYNVYPVDEDWFGSPHQEWVQKQFQTCQFFYGVDAGRYPEKAVNIEEYEMLAEKEGEIARLAELSTLTEFRRRITGQESYFPLTVAQLRKKVGVQLHPGMFRPGAAPPKREAESPKSKTLDFPTKTRPLRKTRPPAHPGSKRVTTPQDVGDLCEAMVKHLGDKDQPAPVARPTPEIFETLELPGRYKLQTGEIFGEKVDWIDEPYEVEVTWLEEGANLDGEPGIDAGTGGWGYAGYCPKHKVYLRYNDTFEANEHCLRILEGPLGESESTDSPDVIDLGGSDSEGESSALTPMTPSPAQLLFRTRYWSYVPGLIPNPDEVYDSLLPQLEKVCDTYTISMYGKSFESRKVSCLFAPDVQEVGERADAKSKGFDYSETPAFEWEKAPEEIHRIRKLLEEFFGYRTDYVLCHIYRGITTRETTGGKTVEEVGQDYIGWHNDKEALDSEIYSVSLGASRRFQFRPLKATKGYTDELLLHSGDVVHMNGPRKGQKSCQNTYKHQVPQMSVADLTAHIEASGAPALKGRKTYAALTKHIKKHDIAPTRINLTFRQFED